VIELVHEYEATDEMPNASNISGLDLPEFAWLSGVEYNHQARNSKIEQVDLTNKNIYKSLNTAITVSKRVVKTLTMNSHKKLSMNN